MNDLQKLVVNIAQGNIGVLKVLVEIGRTDPVFLNPLGISIILTKSKSYGIWQVYKDICDFDIEKTKKILRDWFENSVESLEEWLENTNKR
jgi:hypothetical protein